METTKRWPLMMSALLMVGLVSLVGLAYALDRSRPMPEEATAPTTPTERATTSTTRPAGAGVLTTPQTDPAAPAEAEVLGRVQVPTVDFTSLFRRPSASFRIPSIILPDFAALYGGGLNDQVTPAPPVTSPVVTSPPPTTPPATHPPTTEPPTTQPPTTEPPTTEPPTTEPPTTEPPTTEPPTTTTEPPPDTLPPNTTPGP